VIAAFAAGAGYGEARCPEPPLLSFIDESVIASEGIFVDKRWGHKLNPFESLTSQGAGILP
jgi:hypothetical protein